MPKSGFQLPALTNTLGPDGKLWAWIGKYDDFLGYMAWVMESLKAGEKGFEPL
ncbi:MAG: hypothetical protein HY735_28275 [Verrucomicrobia bacterium]|nr:hypothetical protein [Verrucomicrobiota bacterium]